MIKIARGKIVRRFIGGESIGDISRKDGLRRQYVFDVLRGELGRIYGIKFWCDLHPTKEQALLTELRKANAEGAL